MGIAREEKKMSKLQSVLERMRARREYQADLHNAARAALHAFRVGKQAALNGLDVTAVMAGSQMALGNAEQYYNMDAPAVENTEEASAADPLLVFSDDKWRELQTRTEELRTERVMHKNKFK